MSKMLLLQPYVSVAMADIAYICGGSTTATGTGTWNTSKYTESYLD